MQESRLCELVQHAYHNVPYYHSLFNDVGLSPGDIRSLADLPRIPVSTREALQSEAMNRRMDQSLDLAQCHELRTSGSSGKPLNIVVTANESRTRQMTHFRALLTAGFRWNDQLLHLGLPKNQRAGLHERVGLFRAERIHRDVPIEKQFQGIRETNPSFFWAAPSKLQVMCDHVGRPMNEWMQPRVVITSAEMLQPQLAQRIDEELGAERLNFYGCIETGRIAYECSAHQGLHINTDQVIIEFVRDGQTVPTGEPGLVVVTALNAFGSPFIRYELGDTGRLLCEPCSCGSPFPLMGPPEGRTYELVIMPSGRTISPFLIDHWVNESSRGSHFQVIQHRPDHLEVLFVNNVEDGNVVSARLRERFQRELKEPVRVDVRQVDSIPNDGLKYRSFVRKF
jgi:phenylacetate-CoA ligase